MSNEIIKLWGAGTARTLRPIWIAEELEVEYELNPIGPELEKHLQPSTLLLIRSKKFLALNMGVSNFQKVLQFVNIFKIPFHLKIFLSLHLLKRWQKKMNGVITFMER